MATVIEKIFWKFRKKKNRILEGSLTGLNSGDSGNLNVERKWYTASPPVHVIISLKLSFRWYIFWENVNPQNQPKTQKI